MTRLSIQVSEGLRQAVRLPPEEVPDRLRRELAVRLYAKELLTFGQARQLADMTRWDFRDLLDDEGILRRYDVEELEDDLQTLETPKSREAQTEPDALRACTGCGWREITP